MNEVRIVAFSDSHGIANLDRIAAGALVGNADIVAIAGDVQTCLSYDSVTDFYVGRFSRFVKVLKENGIDVVVTPGNHDSHLVDVMGELIKKDGLDNLHILVDEEASVKGVRFYGTPWCPTINGMWSYEMGESSLSEVYRKIPTGVDVLLAHTPPLGVYKREKWDLIAGRCEHLGSESLLNEILVKEPRTVVFGHIHSGRHAVGRIGQSKIVNVSLLGEDYRVRYRPAELLFTKDGRVGIRANGRRRFVY